MIFYDKYFINKIDIINLKNLNIKILSIYKLIVFIVNTYNLNLTISKRLL